MYAALRATNLVLCFILAQILLLRLTNASLGSLEEENTDESTITDLHVVTSTEQQFRSATISLESTTSKELTTSRDQIMSSTSTPTAGLTTTGSGIPTETTTTYETSTTKFEEMLSENEENSPSKIEGSRYEVR